jgi:hypothetical protein
VFPLLRYGNAAQASALLSQYNRLFSVITAIVAAMLTNTCSLEKRGSDDREKGPLADIAKEEYSMMEATEIARTVLLAWQSDDKFTLMKYLAPDFIAYDWLPMPISTGTFILIGHLFKAAFPDWNMNATDFRQDGERVHVKIQTTGTHTGNLVAALPGFPAVPPTGRKIALPENDLTLTLRNNRIARLDSRLQKSEGLFSIFTQLGLDPAQFSGVTLPS